MRLATSYFYQIRFFKPYMIPLSTALWDPKWYHNNQNKYFKYIDKNGVINGLRYESLNPPLESEVPENHQYCTRCTPAIKLTNGKNCNCDFLWDYAAKISKLDYKSMMNDFELIAQSVRLQLKFNEDPIIVLMVHEPPTNPCSEREILHRHFNRIWNYPLEELKYPIEMNYL